MTPPIEPEAEPLTASELDDLRTQVELSSKRRMALDAWNILATIDRLTERVEKAGWLAEQDSCTIDRLTRERDALLSQLWAQRDRTSFWETLHDERVESLEAERDTWRQRAEEAEECIVWVKCDDPEHERLAAAERTVREQREALELIDDVMRGFCVPDHEHEHCVSCIASAALAPNTEGEGT